MSIRDAMPSQSATSATSMPAPQAGSGTQLAEPSSVAAGDTTGVRERIATMRDAACEEARPRVRSGGAPIRVMARMVADLTQACRELGFPAEIMATEVVNRTIGDIDLRRVSAVDDGEQFATLADDMGIALPGEAVAGHVATGATYHWLRARMEDFERQLLQRHFDVRMYDLAGIGNPLLRGMVADRMRAEWGLDLPVSQIHLSLGSLDGLDKFFRGFALAARARGQGRAGVLFPAPGFNVPEWQAGSVGLHVRHVRTHAKDHFKITPELLESALRKHPDVGAVYLTISNNPTAFSFSPEELRALVATAAAHGALVIADMAYVGTGDGTEDRARAAVFGEADVLPHVVLVCSLSKTHTLTGDRFGWVAFGTSEMPAAMSVGWTNSMASLPADWQLRYMACIQLFAERPELQQRIRALYHHRRERLIRQLRTLNQRHHVFARVNLDDGGTIYNWSQLRAGEDVFSLFSKTGIAGVPGSAFGYSDAYVRLSVGCIPVPATV